MTTPVLPTPHLEKLVATLKNTKLPRGDRRRIQAALERYRSWINEVSNVRGKTNFVISKMVDLLISYKLYIDIDLIYDSQDDFLYRQKGQLKIDNSIIEEFLPWLFRKALGTEIGPHVHIGPTNCYSAIYFDSTLRDSRAGAGITVRTKDQDFAVSKKLYIKASHSPQFKRFAEVETHIAFIATEIKTNLDKTMFQEACATARDLKIAVPSSRYSLMCEWLDMTPISTAATDLEEVLILRGKRLASNVRKEYSYSARQRMVRGEHIAYLTENRFRQDVFARWISHMEALLTDTDVSEDDVLDKGYF